jgi:WD40 repeat protein
MAAEWILISGELRRPGATLSGHTARQFDAAFAPRDAAGGSGALRLATASEDGTVRVWNASEDGGADCVQILHGAPEDEMLRVGWSRDACFVAAGTSSEDVHVWSVHDGREVLRARVPSTCAVGAVVESAAPAQHGAQRAEIEQRAAPLRARVARGDFAPELLRQLADAEDALRVLGAAPPAAAAAAPAEEETEQIYVTSWFPRSADADGTRLLVASEGTCSEWRVRGSSLTCAARWEIDTRTALITGGIERNPNATCYVFDAQFGRLASTGSSEVLAAACGDGSVRIRDWASGIDVAALGVRDGHSRFVTGTCFSGDGRTIASSSGDGSVMLWDTRMWRKRVAFQAHTGPCFGCAFVPPGAATAAPGSALAGASDSVLYSWSKDGSVRLWDASGAVRDDSGERRPAQLGCIEAPGCTLYKGAFAWDEARRGGGAALVLALAGDLTAAADEEAGEEGAEEQWIAQLRYGSVAGEEMSGGGSSTGDARKRMRPPPPPGLGAVAGAVAAI